MLSATTCETFQSNFYVLIESEIIHMWMISDRISIQYQSIERVSREHYLLGTI